MTNLIIYIIFDWVLVVLQEYLIVSVSWPIKKITNDIYAHITEYG